jgi:hypothetical protein
MAKNKTTEEISNQERDESLPDFIASGEGLGFEGIDSEDLELPRIKLIQSISPEKDKFNVAEGEFFHNVTEESFGSEVTIIPIIIQKAFVLWSPKEDGRGILARANDGVHWQPSEGEFEVAPITDMPKKKVKWVLAKTVKESGLAEFGSSIPDDEDSKPAATKQYNILAYLPDFPEASPCVVTLQRSAIKLGKKLNSKLKVATQSKGVDLFAFQLKMSSTSEKNANDQKFFSFRFDMDGYAKDKKTFDICKSMYKAYSTSGFGVKMDSEEGVDSVSKPIGKVDEGVDIPF